MFMHVFHFVCCTACHRTPFSVENLSLGAPTQFWLINIAEEFLDVMYRTLGKHLKRREKTLILSMSQNTKD